MTLLPRPLLAALPLALAACAPAPSDVASVSAPVVYGADGRQDAYAVADPALRQLAVDTFVAFVPDLPGYLIARDEGGYLPHPYSLADAIADDYRLPLCEGERFATQPTIAFCSGTLIAEDLVLTAGHCTDEGACPESTRLVVDYRYAAEGVLEPIEEEDLYRCAEVLAHAHDLISGRDFAVLRLDRPVTGRAPAPLDPRLTLELSEALRVIGFPNGLPLKVDQGGKVKRVGGANYFEASTDTFAGSSGSGVFDADGELIGILVRGAVDYVQRDDCMAVNTLPEEGLDAYEDVTYLGAALAAYCGVDGADEEVCEGAPEPPATEGGRRGCALGAAGGGLGWWSGVALLLLTRRRPHRARSGRRLS